MYDTGRYGMGVTVALKDMFTRQANNISASMGSLDASFSQHAAGITKSVKMIQAGGMAMGAGMAMLALPVMLVRSTIDTQRALGELRSVGIKDFKALEDAAMKFSNTWSGTTTPEFLTAAYDVKSALANLSDEAIGAYTTAAALTAKATKASIQEMVGAFTAGYAIFKPLMKDMTDIQFGNAYSGGLAKAVAIFKTTGPQMADAIRDIGAVAATANRPLEEQLAILGQLQATMPGAMAGTSYKAFMLKAAEAGKALGLPFTDSAGRLRGIADILQTIKGKFPDLSKAAAQVKLTKAFGSDDAYKFVTQMMPGLATLKNNINDIALAMKAGTAVSIEMGNAMNEDLGAACIKISQGFHNLKMILGESLLPIFKPLAEKFDALILRMQGAAKACPVLAFEVGALTTAVGALAVAVGLVTIGYNGVLIAKTALVGTWQYMKAKVDMLTASYIANASAAATMRRSAYLGMAVPGVPVAPAGASSAAIRIAMSAIAAISGTVSTVVGTLGWWLIPVVAGVAAQFYLWYRYIQFMKPAFREIWKGFKEGFGAGVTNAVLLFKMAWIPWKKSFFETWNIIKPLVLKTWDSIKPIFQAWGLFKPGEGWKDFGWIAGRSLGLFVELLGTAVYLLLKVASIVSTCISKIAVFGKSVYEYLLGPLDSLDKKTQEIAARTQSTGAGLAKGALKIALGAGGLAPLSPLVDLIPSYKPSPFVQPEITPPRANVESLAQPQTVQANVELLAQQRVGPTVSTIETIRKYTVEGLSGAAKAMDDRPINVTTNLKLDGRHVSTAVFKNIQTQRIRQCESPS